MPSFRNYATTSVITSCCFRVVVRARDALCNTVGTVLCETRRMKRCPSCRQHLPMAAFAQSITRRYGASYCRACQSDYAKAHYRRNKNLQLSRCRAHLVKYRQRNRDFVQDYLARNPCIDCKESDVRVLEFDHVRGKKEAAISALVYTGAPLKRILLEIAKCEVRCANCHRRKTVEQLRWARRIGA